MALKPALQDYDFDLEQLLDGVIELHTHIPQAALTADVLGTERKGYGTVIGERLIATIGYLVTEADTVWIKTNDGRAVPGHVAGFDHETGLGLVEALRPLDLPPLALGTVQDLAAGSDVVMAGAGGLAGAIAANVVGRQEFAGYWEYLLDDAVFVAPGHPHWGGTAMISAEGRLLGIGSLQLQQSEDAEADPAINMVVPIDLLPPILDDLITVGRARRPAKPWLGLYATEVSEQVVVIGLSARGPARDAGLQPGDVILRAGETAVRTLAQFLRAVRALGDAGVEVPLTLSRGGKRRVVRVASVDRRDMLLRPHLH